ncbi:MAG: 2-oxoglutarate synthase KorA [Candidatus Parcubacteria bacterium]|jgi:2-oxoglutarate ferredoxin oxidoreductase subunit alpha
MEKKFLMGNEALGRAARAAGAKAMYGYPITPSSEILHFWSKEACEDAAKDAAKRENLIFLQAEDETGASFMLIGGVLAGVRAFTATGGPGHVLMQDAFSMAEAMRLPVVAYINQRGGPSTSTVIYSQSEVNLACFGGNGNGFRIVYSPASLQELYDYGIKVFNVAWQERFPTFLLGDGYLAKMMGEVEIYDPKEKGIHMVEPEAYMLEKTRARPLETLVPSPELHIRKGTDGTSYDCFRNCLNMEEETLAVNLEIQEAWDRMAPGIIEYAEHGDASAEILIVAHGIVSASAKSALSELARLGIKARLFRPITLRPFPEAALRKAAQGMAKIIVPESAINQLARFVKDALYGHCSAPIIEYARPSIGITPAEIVRLVQEHAKQTA